MKILASLIKWVKTGNVVLLTISVLAFFTAVAWVAIFNGKANAAEQPASVAVQGSTQTKKAPDEAWGMALLAAAVSTGLATIGAGIAVSMVGSAALGAMAEKPEIMGRSIIFVGLAEGIAIYGLIISIMILGKL